MMLDYLHSAKSSWFRERPDAKYEPLVRPVSYETSYKRFH